MKYKIQVEEIKEVEDMTDPVTTTIYEQVFENNSTTPLEDIIRAVNNIP